MDAKSKKKVEILMGNLRQEALTTVRDLEDMFYAYKNNYVTGGLYELKLDNARKELAYIDNMIETKIWDSKKED